MSAENAWRIAMEAAAEPAYGMATDWWYRASDYVGEDIKRLSERISSLPMPPAFRAAVEAEAAEAFEAGVRAGWQSSTEDFNSEMWVGPLSEQRVEDDVVARAVRDRALLSRLEAKGESHE